jgi:peptidoglycan/LPS O-acetylase OafA/YrhL
LVAAAVIQIAGIGLFYLRVYWAGFPAGLDAWVDIGPLQYLRFAFSFPLGMVAGMFPKQTKDVLARFKPELPWLLAFTFLLSALESSWAYYTAAGNPALWPIGGDQTRFSAAIFSLVLVACFIVFDRIEAPLNKQITKLGTRSYGLYLSHYVILGVLGKLFERVLPPSLSPGWLVFPLLFALTTVLAALMMEIVARSPAKTLYKYIFG